MNEYDQILQEWKKNTDMETLLKDFFIIFSYHSGAIENPEIAYGTVMKIFKENRIENFTGNVRTIYEIWNHKVCTEWLQHKIVQREPVTPELIKDMHYYLTKETYDGRRHVRGERPGEYKKHDYVVGNDQGALPEEVASEIEELCDELTDIPDRNDNIIRTAAYLHCKFENIHPFADGNGRVGRMLMNYFLLIHSHPPVVIPVGTREKYYELLDIYDSTGDISGFVEYLKEQTVLTWEIRNQNCLKLSSSPAIHL